MNETKEREKNEVQKIGLDNINDLWNRAKDYKEKNDYNGALTFYSEAIKMASLERRFVAHQAQISLDKSSLLFKLGRFKAALDSVKEATKAAEPFDKFTISEFTYANSKIFEGICLYRIHEYREAIRCFDEIIGCTNIQDYSYRARAFKNKGNAQSLLKEYREAIISYDKAIDIVPDYPAAFTNKGNAHYGLEEYGKALASYDSAIALLNHLPQYPDGEDCEKQIINRDEVTNITYLHRGQTKFKLGDELGALEDFEKIDDGRSNSDLTLALKYNNIGLCQQSLGNRNEAKDSYLKAIRYNSNLVYPHYNLAVIYAKKDKSEALKHLQACRRIDRNFPEASDAIEELESPGLLRWIMPWPSSTELEPVLPYTNVFRSKDGM